VILQKFRAYGALEADGAHFRRGIATAAAK
jgi:hypothetical protein